MYRPLGYRYFFRNSFGLILTGGACFFNYFLIAYDLKSSESNSQYVAIGVYLFGIFMTFTSKNLLFHNVEDNIPQSKSSFYLYSLEFGVPLVSALFVAYKVFSTKGPTVAIFHFFFLIFLFIIPGKLFLSMLKQLTDDLKRIRQNGQSRKVNGLKAKVYNDNLKAQKEELSLLDMSLKTVIDKRYINEQELARLEEEKENKKKLFMSEYHLARTFSRKFNPDQEFNYLTQLKSS